MLVIKGIIVLSGTYVCNGCPPKAQQYEGSPVYMNGLAYHSRWCGIGHQAKLKQEGLDESVLVIKTIPVTKELRTRAVSK